MAARYYSYQNGLFLFANLAGLYLLLLVFVLPLLCDETAMNPSDPMPTIGAGIGWVAEAAPVDDGDEEGAAPMLMAVLPAQDAESDERRSASFGLARV